MRVCVWRQLLQRQSLPSKSTAVSTTVASSLAANTTRKRLWLAGEAAAAVLAACVPAAAGAAACGASAAASAAASSAISSPPPAAANVVAAAACGAGCGCSSASNTYTGLGLPPNLDMRRFNVPWRSTACTSSAATCLQGRAKMETCPGLSRLKCAFSAHLRELHRKRLAHRPCRRSRACVVRTTGRRSRRRRRAASSSRSVAALCCLVFAPRAWQSTGARREALHAQPPMLVRSAASSGVQSGRGLCNLECTVSES